MPFADEVAAPVPVRFTTLNVAVDAVLLSDVRERPALLSRRCSTTCPGAASD
jgi:hypothetical protein